MMARAVRHPGLHDASGTQLAGRLLDVAGCETYVVDAPRRRRPRSRRSLLLHGFGDTADCWRRVVPPLARRHRVIAIDVPPFGRSGDPPDVLRGRSDRLLRRLLPGAVRRARASSARRSSATRSAARSRSGSRSSDPARVDRLVLIAPAGLGDRAPWWWHAIAGRRINWAALLRLPNPVAGQAIKAALRGFLEERLVHDTRAHGRRDRPLRPPARRAARARAADRHGPLADPRLHRRRCSARTPRSTAR